MTRRKFMRAITGMASVPYVIRGESVSPLSSVARASCPRIVGKMPATRKGETPSPPCPEKYPGQVIPLWDIGKQSKWSG
jgi:hypothetical protein